MFSRMLFQPVQRHTGKKAFLKPMKAVHLVLAVFRTPEHSALICFVREVRWLLKYAFELKNFPFLVVKLKSCPVLGPTSLHWFHQPYPLGGGRSQHHQCQPRLFLPWDEWAIAYYTPEQEGYTELSFAYTHFWAKTGCTAHNASNKFGGYSYPPEISKDSHVAQLEQGQDWHEVQSYRSLTSEEHCSPWAFRSKECNLSSNYEKGPLVVTRCNLTKGTPLSREVDLPTILCELPSYSSAASLLAPVTAGKSLAPSSICHMMQEHAIQACGDQQSPQNSTMSSWNTTCAATQRCTAHCEVTMNLGISMHPFCHPLSSLEWKFLI